MSTEDDNFPSRRTHSVDDDRSYWNWAQNAPLGPRAKLLRPESPDQLANMVMASQGRIKVLGSRLAPGRLLKVENEADILLDTGGLADGLLRSTSDTATFAASTPLHDVFQRLAKMGRMLASSPGVIDIQSLAGAMATGTHGQGLRQSSLADEALEIGLLLANGDNVRFDRHHPLFGAAQLALGTLGVLTEVTLKTVPLRLYSCAKSAHRADSLATALYEWNDRFIYSKAWWFPEGDRVHVWNAREANEAERGLYQANGGQPVVQADSSDAMNATVERTLRQMENDTRIRDSSGKPYRTVTRFKDFSDIIGDVYQIFCQGIATPQINIEIGIPLRNAGRVIEKIKRWHAEARPHMHYPIILRCTGPSSAWLSPAYGEATCFFGFVVYYAEDGTLSPEGVRYLMDVERLLAAEGGRPHWGKYFHSQLYHWPTLYPRWEAFRQAKAELDPKGKFSNAFLTQLLA